MDKTKLEERITCTAIEVFSFPEEIRRLKDEKQDLPEDLKTLRTKLAGYVLQWAKFTFTQSSLKNFGTEIMECVSVSIRSFSDEPSNYIKYISASVKNQIQRGKEKQAVFEKQSIKLPQKKRGLIKQIQKYAELSGMNIEDANTQLKLSEIFHLGLSEIGASGVPELLQWNDVASVQRVTTINDDGEEISLLDSESVFKNSGGRTPEQELVQKDEIPIVLTSIDKVFTEQQDRTKSYLSALITRQVLEELESAGIDSTSSLEHLKGRAFAMTDEALKVKEDFLSGDSCPSQQEVASWFGKDKTDASRTMRNFLDKLKRRGEAVSSLKT